MTLQEIEGEEGWDEWSPALTEQNKYLVNIHEQLADEVGDTDTDINLIHVGEPFWGAKHPDGAIHTSERVQVDIALGNLERWFDMPNLKRAHFVTGTDAHEFDDNSALKTLVKELRLMYPSVEVSASHHTLIDCEGYLLDVSHHGPYPGSRSWLKGNVAMYYLRDRVMRHLMRGKRPPDLFVRGHYHTKVSTMVEIGDNEYRLVVMPSFLMMTNYARRSTQSEYELMNGGMYFDVDRGEASKQKWITKTLDLREVKLWN